MNKILGFLFNIRPSEVQKFLWLSILATIWGIGSYGIFSFSEAIFIEHCATKSILHAYFFTGLALCLFSTVIMFFLNRFQVNKVLNFLILLSLIINITVVCLFSSLRDQTWFLMFFKSSSWVLTLSSYISLFAFFDQFCDMQDSKKIFCIFNALFMLGDAIGGFLVGYTLPFFGVKGLICLFSCALLISIPLIEIIQKKIPCLLEEHQDNETSISKSSYSKTIKTIFKSQFAIGLISFYFLAQFISILTEFCFMTQFKSYFAENTQTDIMAFLGKTCMMVSIFNTIFSLFAYQRIVKKIGLKNMVLIPALIFITLFIGWKIQVTIYIAIFGMITREAVCYAFDDNNLQLMITGVPSKIKNQTRVIIESFVEPLSLMACSSTILLIEKHNKLKYLYDMGLALSFVTLISAFIIKKAYQKAVFTNIPQFTFKSHKISQIFSKFSKSEQQAIELPLLSSLKKHWNEKEQLTAYLYLLKLENKKLLPHLLNHFNKFSLPGKIKAIEMFRDSVFANIPIVIDKIKGYKNNLAHPEMKEAVTVYLSKIDALSINEVINDINNLNPGISSAAIVTIKKNGCCSNDYDLLLKKAIEKQTELLSSNNKNDLLAILTSLSFEDNKNNIPILIPFLSNEDFSISIAAANALNQYSISTDPELSRILIRKLKIIKHSETRLLCLDVLKKSITKEYLYDLLSFKFCSKGNFIIETIIESFGKCSEKILLEALTSKEMNVKSRCLAAKILKKINNKFFQKHVSEILNVEIVNTYSDFYHSYSLPKEFVNFDLSLLRNLLITKFNNNLDLVIQLLGISGSMYDCEILPDSIRSVNRKTKAQAIESLEKTCSSSLFKILTTLIDDSLSVSEKLNKYIKFGFKPQNINQVLDLLSESNSKIENAVSTRIRTILNAA